MATLPAIIVIATVWCYWLSVVVMIGRSHVLHRTSAGARPRIGRERRMWAVWIPTILAWLVAPILAQHTQWPLLALPAWATQEITPAVNWIAALAAVVAYALTVRCWLTLGDNWSLAIVPGKRTVLVTRGMYTRIRHPIYALGLLLMVATVAVAPSPAMLVAALSHAALVLMKCRGEEAFLKSRHGRAYEDYCNRTNRFFPRLRQPAVSDAGGAAEWRDAA